MSAEKLYYVNQYAREATAVVTGCVPVKGGCAVTLNQTIFYPTGGGQPCDLGTIRDIPVLDVTEKDGEIYHLCAAPLEVGSTVDCKIDWDRRFMLMQQHSGEHLVSGLVHQRFGYDNVGFHMGADVITIDFSGELTPAQLREIETAANAAIYQNIQTAFLYPNAEDLSRLPYRSKKELSGWVRLVQFGDIDLCACCGLHVSHTGEIGLIKLISTVRFRGGSRVELLCGKRALDYLNEVADQNREISALFSAKPKETAIAAKRISQELADTQFRVTRLENQLFALRGEALRGKGNVLLFEEPMNPDAIRRLTDAVLQTCGGICLVFSGTDGNYKYALGTLQGDIRPIVKALNAELTGRGGGKPNFAQGSVTASREDIEAFYAKLSLE